MTEQTASRPGRRRALWAVALVLWVAFIWSRSLFSGPESSAQSDLVVSLLRGFFESLGIVDTEVMTFAVRKTAHFLEYLVLGVLAVKAVRPCDERGSARFWRWVCVLVIVAAVPVADETIQLFVPGRSGQVTDMLLDMSGAIVGAAVSSVLCLWSRES